MQKYFISSLLAALLMAIVFVNTPSAHAFRLTFSVVASPAQRPYHDWFLGISGIVGSLAMKGPIQ